MNNISRVIVSLVYYNSLIRDTLEYTLKKDSFDVNVYDYRRNGIINEPKLNTPLKGFIDGNGEKGQELLKKLEDFGAKFYSDTSTVIKKAADGLRVDQAQNVTIIENVVPLYDEMSGVVSVHYNEARKQNLLDPRITTLLNAAGRMYRAVAILSIFGEFIRQFQEFNTVMKESNGQRTPQSNFIEQDLGKLIQSLSFVTRYSGFGDPFYTEAIHSLWVAMEYMNGARRDYPAGKNLNDLINQANKDIADFVKDAEAKYNAIYPEMVNELIEDNKKAREAADAAKTEEAK